MLIQVSTTKRTPATSVKKSGNILGSKLAVKNRSLNTSANEKYVRAGIFLAYLNWLRLIVRFDSRV